MTGNRLTRAASYFPLYVACIVLASLFWKAPTLLSICYVGLSIFMLHRWHTSTDVTYFFLAFTLGPLGEAVAIHFGAWRYTEVGLLIPAWLPLAWGISGLFLKKTTEALAGASSAEAACTPTMQGRSQRTWSRSADRRSVRRSSFWGSLPARERQPPGPAPGGVRLRSRPVLRRLTHSSRGRRSALPETGSVSESLRVEPNALL